MGLYQGLHYLVFPMRSEYFSLLEHYLPYFEIVETSQREIIIPNDPSDDKFIQCALSGNAKVIVSGDIHLLSLKVYQDIHILSPSQFLEIVTD